MCYTTSTPRLIAWTSVCAGGRKDPKPIAFGVELEIDKLWLTSDADYSKRYYDLVATVAHHGKTLASGHYTVRPAACCGSMVGF